jgi:hypothetical protein
VSKTGVYLIAPDAPSGEAPIQTTRCLVRFLPFSSSRPRTIARIDREPAWGMNVSSDERWLLFTQYDRVEYDLMLIEDFH